MRRMLQRLRRSALVLRWWPVRTVIRLDRESTAWHRDAEVCLEIDDEVLVLDKIDGRLEVRRRAGRTP